MRKSGKMQRKAKEQPDFSGLKSALSKTEGTARWAYSKVPTLPLLDRPTSAILFFCVAAYLIFTAYIFIAAPKPEFELDIDTSGLDKSSAPGIADGESYTYLIRSGEGRSMQIASLVQKGSVCDGVYVIETAGEEETAPVCVSADGKVDGSDMGSPLVLYSPWMLGASGNFTMTMKATASASWMEITQKTLFRSTGKTEKLGRESYGVEIINDGGSEPALVAYVDAAKRVLLYAEAGNSTITLVKAPFPVAASAG